MLQRQLRKRKDYRKEKAVREESKGGRRKESRQGKGMPGAELDGAPRTRERTAAAAARDRQAGPGGVQSPELKSTSPFTPLRCRHRRGYHCPPEWVCLGTAFNSFLTAMLCLEKALF